MVLFITIILVLQTGLLTFSLDSVYGVSVLLFEFYTKCLTWKKIWKWEIWNFSEK